MAVCFASDTRIATASGETPVQNLRVGDLVLTASGRERPVTWVGSREVGFANAVATFEDTPVRIRAGAFGDNLPHRPLRLSPGHPVLVRHEGQEYLVPVMCLLNGTSVAQIPCSRVVYWHVELDSHDILLAEGLAAESYINLGSREWFAGDVDAIDAGDFPAPASPEDRCRPVATQGPVVEAERRRIDAVFVAELTRQSGWPAENAQAAA